MLASRARSFAKQSSSDANVGGALFDRDLEVVTHAHGEETREAGPLGADGQLVAQLAQADEPAAGVLRVLLERGDRRQADDPQVRQAGQRGGVLGEPPGGEAVLALLVAE